MGGWVGGRLDVAFFFDGFFSQGVVLVVIWFLSWMGLMCVGFYVIRRGGLFVCLFVW